MSKAYDFERAWLARFSGCLDQVAGEAVRKQIMKGSETLSSGASPEDVITWSRQAMDRLDSLVAEDKRREIMTGCACQYPKTNLQAMKDRFTETGDIDLVHQMLQEQFESFLIHTLQLDDELVVQIVRKGWGAAGVKEGNTIIATKIPKSGFLVQYMCETDPDKKRQYYCHCPRVREVLKTSNTISPTYCYCGAGFYKGIWEEILQEPVEVELLKSVLNGDDVCTIAIHLPAES
jgi:hypothetical protein